MIFLFNSLTTFRAILLSLTLLLCITLGNAQSVESTLEKARNLKFTNPDSAFVLLKKVETKIKKGNNPHHFINYHNISGLSNWAIGNIDKADSLLTIALNKAIAIKDDTMQTIINNNLGIMQRDHVPLKQATSYHFKALKSARRSKRLFDIADTYNNIGSVYMHYNINDSAVFYFEQGMLVYFNSMNENKIAEIGYGDISSNIGLVYFDEGKYTLAYNYFFKALKIFEKYKLYDKATIACNNIAEIYFDKYDFKNSTKFCKLALEYEKKSPNEMQKGFMMFVMGKIYHERKILDSAVIYYTLSADLFRKFELRNQLASVLNSLGYTYVQLKQEEKGMNMLNEAIAFNTSMNDTAGLASNYSNLAAIAIEKGDYAKAEKHCSEAMRILKPHMYFSMYIDIYGQASVIASKLGKHQLAYEYLQHHNRFKDSLTNITKEQQQEELAQIYQSEKKEQELKLARASNEKNSIALKHSQEEGKRKSLQLYMALGGSILLLVLAIIMIRSNIIRKRTNKLLAEKNKIIYEQKAEVEEKNKEITDSINYASKIQNAVLPTDAAVTTTLGEHFILFRPKDIVSGDFYWTSHMHDQQILATCDCTGHGVPGGFMTMLGSSMLNEVINEQNIKEPAKILNSLRDKIISALKQRGDTGENKDGMDAVILNIDRKKLKLHYAGANNSFYLVRNKELTEYKPDKQPIGFYSAAKPFTSHEISIQRGDMIYTMTDGYADQFGGESGKKFKYKQLEEILKEISTQSMQLQKQVLNEKLIAWMGNFEQLDDILVVGIRI